MTCPDCGTLEADETCVRHTGIRDLNPADPDHLAEIRRRLAPTSSAGIDEVIYPPVGYCVSFTFGPGGAMVGPFATEDEARAVLASATICVVGADLHPEWTDR